MNKKNIGYGLFVIAIMIMILRWTILENEEYSNILLIVQFVLAFWGFFLFRNDHKAS